MYRSLNHVEFPEGIKSVYINGRYYTKDQFLAEKKRSRSRDFNGRFKKHIQSI